LHFINRSTGKLLGDERTIPVLPGFVEVTYKLVGPKMKRRIAYFDPNLIKDPRRIRDIGAARKLKAAFRGVHLGCFLGQS
jgi:hypothetical protein